MDFVECPDKTCSQIDTYSDNCIIYVDSNSTNCQIPCKLDGCNVEVLSTITCPIWHCVAKDTTTPAATPKPEPSPDESSSTSIILIAVFVIVVFLCFLIGFRFRYKIIDFVLNFWRRQTYPAAFREDDSTQNIFSPLPTIQTDFFDNIELNNLQDNFENLESNDESFPLQELQPQAGHINPLF